MKDLREGKLTAKYIYISDIDRHSIESVMIPKPKVAEHLTQLFAKIGMINAMNYTKNFTYIFDIVHKYLITLF